MNAPFPASSLSLLDAAGVDPERARQVLGEALAGADDGELFLERSESESFVFDDGRLKSASYDSGEGFGLRVVAGETAGYAHAAEISEAAIRRAADSASLAKRGHAGVAAEGPRAPTKSSMARTIRSPRPTSPTRSPCCRRSTPSLAPATRASCRSWPRWPASAGWSRSCAPTAA